MDGNSWHNNWINVTSTLEKRIKVVWGEVNSAPNCAHRQQILVWVFPCSLGSQSFFIYLQLSTVAGADKRLWLSCEGPSIPQPGPRVMIVKRKAKHMAFHSTDARKPQWMSSIEFVNFHNDKYAYSAFQKASVPSPYVLRWPSKGKIM